MRHLKKLLKTGALFGLILGSMNITAASAEVARKFLILACDIRKDGVAIVKAANAEFGLPPLVAVGENCADALGALGLAGFEIANTDTNKDFIIYTLTAFEVCDDGIVEGREICDGGDLGNETCESLGLGAGTLACGIDCRSFDLSACGPIAGCAAGSTVTIVGTDFQLSLDGLQIVFVDTNLNAGGFQPFATYTCDWTHGDALLNIFETGVDPNDGWDEEHVIPSISQLPGSPRSDILELAMDHVATIGELTGDDKTLFNIDDEGNLTYALRIYGADGELADCVAWGHDVPAMFAGNVPSNNSSPTDQSEINSSNCRLY